MTKWLGLSVIPVVLATALVAAQGPTNQATPFRATTDYFSTHVIVQDKDGKFVPDLREEEFKVYEDGVLQKLSTFERWIGGRVIGGLATSTAPLSAPVMEGLILPTTRAQTDASGRLFIIFIDDLHLQPGDTPRVKDLLKKIRDTLVRDNDLVGFVSSGKSSIEIDPAYDIGHRRFNEAIEKVMGGGLTPQEILDGATMEGAEGPSSLRYNTHVAFMTAYELLEQMGNIPDRRKAFVYVSNGYDFDPFKGGRLDRMKEFYETYGVGPQITDGSDQNDTEENVRKRIDSLREAEYNKRTEFSIADLVNEVAQLARAAQKANVTFYTMDPRGLIASGDAGAMSAKISYSDWRDMWMQQHSSLQTLADETGGFCTCMNNDFEKALRRIDAETSDYYVIGYTSNNPDPLKLRRLVKLEVTRPGLQPPTYRSEYYLPRPKR